MLAELGQMALCLALAASLATLPAALRPGAGASPALAGRCLYLAATCVGLAFLALLGAFATDDFSVASVAGHSHRAQPFFYKLSAAWGHHEGSLILFIGVLAGAAAWVVSRGHSLGPRLLPPVLATLALIQSAFLAFVLATSNPFARLDPTPIDGNGLNPLLQHPALALHPPLLYAGMVGLAVAFAFGVGGLITGTVDRAWARALRPFVLLPWALLTAGIALGAWWAYAELGWGGFWFWDPVENASLMPWLVATALVHGLRVIEIRETAKRWTLFLAILGFGLSLAGSFLVRSGLLTSVHAFANDPTRGLVLLAITMALLIGALALFAWRAPDIANRDRFAAVSREGALVLNNVLTAIAAMTLLLGIVWPVVIELLGARPITVGPPYYHATVVPLLLPLVLLCALGVYLPWGALGGGRLRRRFLRMAGLTLALVAGTGLTLAVGAFGPRPVLEATAVALAAGLIGASALDLWRQLRRGRRPAPAPTGAALAHLGLGLLVLGMGAATGWSREQLSEPAGDGSAFATAIGIEARLGPTRLIERGNHVALSVPVQLADGHRLTPERRFYAPGGTTTTEAAIHSDGLWADWLATLGPVKSLADPTPSVRTLWRPLISLIWLGAGLMSAGALLALAARRPPRPAALPSA